MKRASARSISSGSRAGPIAPSATSDSYNSDGSCSSIATSICSIEERSKASSLPVAPKSMSPSRPSSSSITLPG